jgi:DegV family protein with EDD domain
MDHITQSPPPEALLTLDGPTLAGLLVAGIRHLFSRRDYINRINVFPVPDADTGTNMAFTFKALLEVIEQQPGARLPQLLEAVGSAALDGARGNSGAIMAQFLHGCQEASATADSLDAEGLARVCTEGARLAWTAMSEPVPGTLPTVLEDFAAGLSSAAEAGQQDLCQVFAAGLLAAQRSLDNTPNLLPALKQAGVVDAGGQGFVDLLVGIDSWLREGVLDPLELPPEGGEHPAMPDTAGMGIGDHQYCTECVVEGNDIDRVAVMARLAELDQSSLVVAGGARRVRVHIHVNNPAEVFLALESFGEITQQKADDMQWQHGLLNLQGEVAVVTDSGADLPPSEVERQGIHVVPVRVSFGDREYLDGVSLQPAEFYRLLDAGGEHPKTSQPPPRDFKRVFELLTVHGYQVLHVGISSLLSGTTQAARSAATQFEDGQVQVFDTFTGSCGEGLLALAAAEAAAEGQDMQQLQALLTRLQPLTHTFCMPHELSSAVRGGRLPAWVGRLASWLRITPILQARDGKLKVGGVRFGRGVSPASLARLVLKKMPAAETFRILISHADNPDGARELRRLVLAGHGRIHSCHLAECGPALGAHLGRNGLVVAAMPDPHERH